MNVIWQFKLKSLGHLLLLCHSTVLMLTCLKHQSTVILTSHAAPQAASCDEQGVLTPFCQSQPDCFSAICATVLLLKAHIETQFLMQNDEISTLLLSIYCHIVNAALQYLKHIHQNTADRMSASDDAAQPDSTYCLISVHSFFLSPPLLAAGQGRYFYKPCHITNLP